MRDQTAGRITKLRARRAMIQPPNRTLMARMPLPARSNQAGPVPFRQHRSSIKRQKQQNSSCVSEWESWRDNSSYNSTSDTREHRANCSKNHLARVRIDCHLTHQDVERENCSGGNNQISADDCDNAAKSEKESVQHRPFYLIPRLWHRAIWPTLLSPLLRAALPASHGTMGADSRDAVGAGVEVCGCVCGCESKADRPTNWSKLASASFTLPS